MIKIEAIADENGVMSKLEVEGAGEILIKELASSTYGCINAMAEMAARENNKEIEIAKSILLIEYISTLERMINSKEKIHNLNGKFYMDKEGEIRKI